VLQAIDLDSIFANGYSFLIEMIFTVQRNNFQIGEVPIVFEDRRRGTSKISQNEVWRALQTVGRLSARRLREKFTGKRAN
jgi:dolichol-phosphate mannosyltransferase